MSKILQRFLLLSLLLVSACSLKNNGEPYPGSKTNMENGGDLSIGDPTDFDENVTCYSANADFRTYLRLNGNELRLAIYRGSQNGYTTLVDRVVKEAHTQSKRMYLANDIELIILKTPAGGSAYSATLYYDNAFGEQQVVPVTCNSTGYSED